MGLLGALGGSAAGLANTYIDRETTQLRDAALHANSLDSMRQQAALSDQYQQEQETRADKLALDPERNAAILKNTLAAERAKAGLQTEMYSDPTYLDAIGNKSMAENKAQMEMAKNKELSYQERLAQKQLMGGNSNGNGGLLESGGYDSKGAKTAADNLKTSIEQINNQLELSRDPAEIKLLSKQKSDAIQKLYGVAVSPFESSLSDSNATYKAPPKDQQSAVDRINKYDPIITKASEKFGVPAELIKGVIHTESRGIPTAESEAGAVGLMQLMPETAQRFKVDPSQRTDPEKNIMAGTEYLQFLLKKFNGDHQLAAAGYNAGEGAVEKYNNNIPPYKETKAYVPKVMDAMSYYVSKPSSNDETAKPAKDSEQAATTTKQSQAIGMVSNKDYDYLDKAINDAAKGDKGLAIPVTDAMNLAAGFIKYKDSNKIDAKNMAISAVPVVDKETGKAIPGKYDIGGKIIIDPAIEYAQALASSIKNNEYDSAITKDAAEKESEQNNLGLTDSQMNMMDISKGNRKKIEGLPEDVQKEILASSNPTRSLLAYNDENTAYEKKREDFISNVLTDKQKEDFFLLSPSDQKKLVLDDKASFKDFKDKISNAKIEKSNLPVYM